MVNIIETDKNGLCFVGDIHGEFKSISGLMKHTMFTDTIFIFCGDCGFGFEKGQYYTNMFNRLNRTVSKFNNQCIFIRGNHDSKSYFDGYRINRKYFKAVSDYTIIKTPMHNILCVGGATSIDRLYRISVDKQNALKYKLYHSCTLEEAEKLCPKCYWPDEAPIYDENVLNEINKAGIKIDIVATHTCPSFVEPITKDGIQYWLRLDTRLNEVVDNERKVMDNIYNKLISDGHHIKKWFYGHYHYHHQEYVNDIQFVMLDMYRNGNFDIFDIKD